jgi:dTDP-4-amino-4,6-dideoxygalactose transaminase
MLTLGHKYDLTDFQAALLIGQLERINLSYEKRLKVFERYEQGLAGMDFPERIGKHACHMFTIRVDNRDKVRERLEEAGIQTSIHYEPIHLEPFYREMFGYKEGMFPVAERLGQRIITLPTYNLTKRQQDYVIKEVLCASP